jgi:hypothetical protein
MIDTTKPIETTLGKPAKILFISPREDNEQFPIVGRISKSRICSWDYEGNPSTNMSIDKIKNSPDRVKVSITFEDIKEGVMFRSKSGNEIYIPLKCHSRGVVIVWDDSGSVSYLTYEELMNLDFEYRSIGPGLKSKLSWKPCYNYRLVDVLKPSEEDDEEEEEDEDEDEDTIGHATT